MNFDRLAPNLCLSTLYKNSRLFMLQNCWQFHQCVMARRGNHHVTKAKIRGESEAWI